MDLNAAELLELVRNRSLVEGEALEVLRNPYCTVEVAEAVTKQRKALTSHKVRELLCGFRGFPFSHAVNLLATLPWTSLLELAKNPRTPPTVRRQSESRLLQRLTTMTLGEKVALSRVAHRAIFSPLISLGDEAVLTALLDNPRLVENDILVVIHRVEASPGYYRTLAAHRRWGQYYGVRKALVTCAHVPLPVALSMLVQLNAVDLNKPTDPSDPAGATAAPQEADFITMDNK